MDPNTAEVVASFLVMGLIASAVWFVLKTVVGLFASKPELPAEPPAADPTAVALYRAMLAQRAPVTPAAPIAPAAVPAAQISAPASERYRKLAQLAKLQEELGATGSGGEWLGH